jgi:outer membrane protein TolC
MKHCLHHLLFAAMLSALSLLSGCTQPLRIDGDWKPLHDHASLPTTLESAPETLLKPTTVVGRPPATVLDPDRPARHLTLSLAVAMALENGTVGQESVHGPGVANDDLGSFTGQGLTGSDSIRVLAYQPARYGTSIEAGLARFDPFFSAGIAWRGTDEPNQGFASFSNGQTATLSTALVKPLASGGVFGISFNTDYQILSNPPTGEFAPINPQYVPRLTFGFDQPLLKDFGTEINQLRSSFPSSSLFPAINGRSSSYASEGILITRLRFDQSRAELERRVNFLLLNVHAAYWNLYAAYVKLYVNEQGLRQAHAAWRIAKNQKLEGKIDNAQLSQILAQYEQFRGDRMRALGRVLDAERNLRVLVGLPVDDGQRLVPIDAPQTLPENPDWESAVDDAVRLRPELLIARQEILIKQKNLTLQKNSQLPDLRLQASHTTVGLGSRLDGSGTFIDANGDPVTNNALRSLVGTHFNDWTVGLALNVPLGYRYEYAQVRDARLALAQSYLALKTSEEKATNFLAKQYSAVIETGRVIDIRRLQRVAQGEQVETRFRKYVEGVKDSPLEFLLDAQRQWVLALNQEYQAIIDYNITLATFEFAKGTIMQSCKVRIAEGSLPNCITVRAVENEQAKTRRRLAEERRRAERVPSSSNLSGVGAWPEYAAPSLVVFDAQAPEQTALPRPGGPLGPPREILTGDLLLPAPRLGAPTFPYLGP